MTFIKRKISDLTNVPDDGIFNIMCDRWWMTDGENIFFYREYWGAQCNSQKEVAENLCKAYKDLNIGEYFPVYIDRVFVPYECN